MITKIITTLIFSYQTEISFLNKWFLNADTKNSVLQFIFFFFRKSWVWFFFVTFQLLLPSLLNFISLFLLLPSLDISSVYKRTRYDSDDDHSNQHSHQNVHPCVIIRDDIIFLSFIICFRFYLCKHIRRGCQTCKMIVAALEWGDVSWFTVGSLIDCSSVIKESNFFLFCELF